MQTCTCRVSWIQISPEAIHFYFFIAWGVFLSFFLFFSFFPSQVSSYIHTYIHTCTYIHIYSYVRKDYYFLQIRASAVPSNSISSTNNKTPSDKLKTARAKRQEALSKLREMKLAAMKTKKQSSPPRLGES